jgi:hypothetical protein
VQGPSKKALWRDVNNAAESAVSTMKTHATQTMQATRALSGLLVVFATVVLAITAPDALAAEEAPAWQVHAVSEPSVFSRTDEAECAAKEACDRYQILVLNSGTGPSSGPITLTAVLPAGIVTRRTPEDALAIEEANGSRWECTPGGSAVVTCNLVNPEEPSLPASLTVGGYAPVLEIPVTAPTNGSPGVAVNHISIAGGGAAASGEFSLETSLNTPRPSFGVSEFGFSPSGEDGAPSRQAGGHPWALTTSFGIPDYVGPFAEGSSGFTPVRNVKSASFELPLGFAGNPQATPTCTELQLRLNKCPADSKIGVFAATGGLLAAGQFGYTGTFDECCSAVYNIKPEEGYPAEFGFSFAHQAVFLYASLVHTATGYRVKVAVPGVPEVLETTDASVTLFGEPGLFNGSGSNQAFLTNPATCSGAALSARAVLEAWAEPGHPVAAETVGYQGISGCSQLQFTPTLQLGPSTGVGEGGTTQADKPSAYTANLEVPQTSGFSELATPPVRRATVTLPAGLTLNPAAGSGLVGCQAQGAEGINLGSQAVAMDGRDEGDPEATELGAGHFGGNGSIYDDGLYHSARGHCPLASTLGTVEAHTPLLADGPGGAAPLTGHMYVAEPECGGQAQPECTEASATTGELFRVYLELEGDGVVVKLLGSLSVEPATGQITVTFADAPQLPFSDLRLHVRGGPRAPLANPQTCGQFSTLSELEPWSGAGQTATSSSTFNVTGCGPTMPFAPPFVAGANLAAAGAFTPFALTVTREDGEQDLAGLSVKLPEGLLAKLAGVPLCEEPRAAEGTCSSTSRIGGVTAAAGAGEKPLVLGGDVYLTTGYKGAPFGLSIVVPANAGPYHLGNVVVRATISVDPTTAAATVTSDPLPQSKDGVPFRLRVIHVSVDRPGFVFNPTNCSQRTVDATVVAAQGASVHVSSPFAATSCAALPFKPSFSVATQGKTSKLNGASLSVKLTFPHPGPQSGSQSGESNIHSVHVELPKSLPARLTTLQKACTAAQFESNPAGCPKESIVGHAIAHTPILTSPLQGPAYFVSHGGAKFPELILVLQGEGITIDLAGETFINGKTGVTSSTFANVPDAPVSSFELVLPQGPFSALTANGNLCTQNLVMPTKFVAQNGAVLNQSTHIEVEGCSNALRVVSKRVRGRTVTLGVWVPAAGRLSASGKGLSRGASRASDGRKELKLTLRAARHRRFTTKIRLVFTPNSGKDRRRLGKSVTVRFGR